MNLLKALQAKYRFDTPKGSLNLEQLFELGKTGLNQTYLQLEGQIQTSKGLMGRKGNTLVEEKLEIVKAIFDLIVEQENEAKDSAANAALKQRILGIADNREFEELVEGKSAKELKKLVKKL